MLITWSTTELGFAAATGVVDYLAKRGMPFRKAHEIVGMFVLCFEKHGACHRVTTSRNRNETAQDSTAYA